MKIFYLKRTEDESGVSGTGRVAQGFIFDNEVRSNGMIHNGNDFILGFILCIRNYEYNFALLC